MVVVVVFIRFKTAISCCGEGMRSSVLVRRIVTHNKLSKSRYELEMSGNVVLNPNPSCSLFSTVHYYSYSRSQAQPGFIPFPFPVRSVIPIHSHCHSSTSISSHLLLFFMDTVKQITCKLTTNEAFWRQNN